MALYNSGEINQAFTTIEIAIAAGQGAAGFPYFTKAVWAFDQGQVAMTIESIEAAQKNGYNEPQVKIFIDEIKAVNSYTEKADISDLLNALEKEKVNLDSSDYISRLKSIALKNAFDERTTLSAIQSLQLANVTENEIYEILLQVINVNVNSSKLLEQYIYQCAKTGLSNFGRTALSRIEAMTEPTVHSEITIKFNNLVNQRRQKILNR